MKITCFFGEAFLTIDLSLFHIGFLRLFGFVLFLLAYHNYRFVRKE